MVPVLANTFKFTGLPGKISSGERIAIAFD